MDSSSTALVLHAALTFAAQDRLIQFGGYFTAGYRADNLRAWKQSTSSGNVAYSLYDGERVLAELDSNGAVVNLYGYGAAGLAQRYNTSQKTYYAYTFDPSGNLVERTSPNNIANGTYSDFVTLYDGFGQQLGKVRPVARRKKRPEAPVMALRPKHKKNNDASLIDMRAFQAGFVTRYVA